MTISLLLSSSDGHRRISLWGSYKNYYNKCSLKNKLTIEHLNDLSKVILEYLLYILDLDHYCGVCLGVDAIINGINNRK